LGGVQHFCLRRARHRRDQRSRIEIGEIIVSETGKRNVIVGIWRRVETPVLVNGLASLFALGIAATRGNKMVAMLAALAFAASVLVEGIRATAKYSSDAGAGTTALRTAAQFEILGETTFLTFLICAWSAAALMIAYPIAGLNWLHGWEYGLSFALTALGFAAYLQWLAKQHDETSKAAAVARAKDLTIIQAIAVAVTLMWIVGSGKLATLRADWLANDVFLASGCAIVALSIIFLVRTRALQR
jgi:hypothetical protein